VEQRENVDFKVLRNLTLVVYIHHSGEEDLFLTKVNQYLPKSFKVDTFQESGVIKAEFFITQYEYSLSSFENSCKEYAKETGLERDIDGYRDCILDVFETFFKSNLTCSIAGFLSQKTFSNIKPVCNSSESATQSFSSMEELTNKIANYPEIIGCPAICNLSSKVNLKHQRPNETPEQQPY
jgi:hypothetical protein